MTLLTRIRAAGNAVEPRNGVGPSITPAQLRALLHERIPGEKLARMAVDNPILAEAEVRSICRQLFDADAIAGMAEVSEAGRESLIGGLVDGIFGFGPIQGLLADEEITEVLVNGVHSIYFERGGMLHRAGESFASEEEIRALIDRILGPLGRRIDESSPMVDARLDDGSRVHAVIPPISLIGPLLAIRRFPSHVMTLAEMERSRSVDAPLARFLRWAVASRVNIAVSGGTGTGKTTLLNALSCEIPPGERVITIEDSAELRFFSHPHVVRLEARPASAEGTGEVTIRDLVITALRMRPDRIVVGECRGAEALDMLQAMNTGHDGSLTTLHANSPEDALLRLVTMVRYAADLPVDVIERQVAAAIGLGIQIARDAAGNRFVTRVVEYCFDDGAEGARTRAVYERGYADAQATWPHVPAWVGTLPRRGLAAEEEVEEWMRRVS